MLRPNIAATTGQIMVWHGRERDPKADPAALHVMAAYRAAMEARLPIRDCYLAGVKAWRRMHPEQTAAYAGKQAVTVILAAKEKFLFQTNGALTERGDHVRQVASDTRVSSQPRRLSGFGDLKNGVGRTRVSGSVRFRCRELEWPDCRDAFPSQN
jgi:hypothetical protein